MDSPAVMFEIMANDHEKLMKFYTTVFGWKTENKDGFAYIRFPPTNRPLMGGIGLAKPGVPGWGKGITFYLQVDNLQTALDKISAHGGAVVVEPVAVDGYHFAMFEDPECNLIGIIAPFFDGVDDV